MEAAPTPSEPAARFTATTLGAALAIFAIGLALYARTLGYAFVDWDDGLYVLENPWIRAWTLENLTAIWTGPVMESYFPLQSLSYLLDHSLWGLDPRGFHAQSLVWNALNGVLAFALGLRLSRRLDVAFLAALAFALHHSHVSSVAWISARKELLCTAFLFGTTLAYLRARRGGGIEPRAYAAALLLFAAGCAAKSTIAAYPLFFWLLDAADAQSEATRRARLRRLAAPLPFLVVAAPFVWMNLSVQPTAELWGGDAFAYALLKVQAAWGYVALLIGWAPGQPIYDPPLVSRATAIGAALPLAALPLALFWALRSGRRTLALGLGWLVAGLLPPLLFPVPSFMADRYLYAPSFGFCWLAAAGVVALAERIAPHSAARRRAWILALAALPLLGTAQLSWRYTPAWRDSEALWSYAIERSQDGRAPAALAAVLLRQRRLDEAEEVLRAAPRLGANGELHLAIVLLEQGRFEEALDASERALAIAEREVSLPGDDARLAFARGMILSKLTRDDEARAEWQRALRLDPDHRGARRMLDLEVGR